MARKLVLFSLLDFCQL